MTQDRRIVLADTAPVLHDFGLGGGAGRLPTADVGAGGNPRAPVPLLPRPLRAAIRAAISDSKSRDFFLGTSVSVAETGSFEGTPEDDDLLSLSGSDGLHVCAHFFAVGLRWFWRVLAL